VGRRAPREWIPVGFCWLGDFIPLRTILGFWRSYSRFTGEFEFPLLVKMLKRNSALGSHLRRTLRAGKARLDNDTNSIA